MVSTQVVGQCLRRIFEQAEFKRIHQGIFRQNNHCQPTQTGDTLHIAAALALASKTGVFLAYDPDPKSDDPLLQFYKQAASITRNPVLPYCPKPIFKRVSGIDYDPTAPQTRVSKSLYAEMKKRIEKGSLEWTRDFVEIKTYEVIRNTSLAGFLALLKDYSSYRPITVSGTTIIIAKQFRADKQNAYTTLAKVLASTLTSQEIIKDMSNWNLKSPFPFLKSFYRQTYPLFMELEKSLGLAVVTIGYGPPESRKATKVEPDCHLGEFFKNKIIESKGRAGQVFSFLALLETCPGKIIQIGQKTGGMGSLRLGRGSAALLDMPTIYVEDESPIPLGRTLRKMTGGFADAKSQDMPLRFRVLTWVRILTAKGDSTTIPHLKTLEMAINKTIQGSIFSMKTMLENSDISEDALQKWSERMQTLSP
ncbi:hypothetical protein CPB86DRAFT_819675 [Serendipita vermifera]|nr:hypothetical protein CPB86DRAFT_819675 [Serendipita vermifera]